ncbi:hypothetical protein ACQKQD_12915 [Methylobacterium sp. NPDC080182]|uniref:hypothetical protein n=1 Tax=Methylobacterium sp. NPDC080182 TaxID=3390590 RepID=UPI003D082BFB
MPEHVAKDCFADQAEAGCYAHLIAQAEEWLPWLQQGAKMAVEGYIPSLRAGLYGKTEPRMRASLQRLLKVGYGSRHKDGATALDADQRFMLRLGFEAIALPAMEAALAAVGVAAAFNDAAAALDGLNAALVHLSRSAAPPTAPRVLAAGPAPARRPLRPEDFGCLPIGRP